MEKKDRSKSPILSAEGLATQLNATLPIHMTAGDLEKHPEMSKLLEDLTHRLTPTGMQKETHAKFLQAKHSMEHARQKYLEEATFYRLLRDVLYKDSTSEEHESLKSMREALTLSELQDHLQLLDCVSSKSNSCDDISKNSLETSQRKEQYVFGITPDLVINRSNAHVSNKGIHEISSAIEELLENEWTQIASFHDPIGFMSYDPDEVAKIPESLEQKSRAVATDKNKLAQSVMQNDYLFLQTQEKLVEYGTLLRSLMAKQRLCQYPAVHMESQSSQMYAMLLKLKCNELEMLANTYTSKSVPALKLIRSDINERRARAEKSLARLKHDLRSFDGLDSRFKELLVDYAKIQSDMEMFKATAGKS